MGTPSCTTGNLSQIQCFRIFIKLKIWKKWLPTTISVIICSFLSSVFGFVFLFLVLPSEGHQYLFHSGHRDNPKDKGTVLSLHHSSLHFYRHRCEDSPDHKIQGGTLKNKVWSEEGSWRKSYIPLNSSVFSVTFPGSQKKIIFNLHSNNAMCF